MGAQGHIGQAQPAGCLSFHPEKIMSATLPKKDETPFNRVG